ncbi:MAG: histidine kinase [Deltaproteobacteria bacterium]|nr:MAG: histidine kinase [Deltaproteobacteria bacterium]
MDEKILFVDDEQNILDAIRRQLRKRFNVNTALGPQEGIKAINERGPYAVVVSDLRMPQMDGIEFLRLAREMAPDTVRIMLSGHADLTNAINAVNEGNIFRFLTKPCPADQLSKALQDAIDQYRLVRAEKELLDNTLKGSIKVLTDLLAIVNPEAFGRASRVKALVKDLARHLGISNTWQLETAALLSHVGFVTIPEETLEKIYRNEALTEEENQLFEMHPFIASDLIKNIPRMETVAEIIAFQEKLFDGSGIPVDHPGGEEIPFEARILKVALDYDALHSAGKDPKEIYSELISRNGKYDPKVLRALEMTLGLEVKYEIKEIRVGQLVSGMILAEDVCSTEGRLLVSKGQEISPALCERLKNVAHISAIREPIRVLVRV